MSERTEISWTDSTHNAWMGCTKVSPACDHCYAERDMDHRYGKVKWGAGQPRQRTSEKNRNLPLRWNRLPFYQCADCGWRGEKLERSGAAPCCPTCESLGVLTTRRRVFSSSLSDWLDNEVPIEWLVDLLDTIRRTPNLDWLLLTKRIGNWRSRLEAARDATSPEATHKELPLHSWIDRWINGYPPANVWIGATMESQAVLDRDFLKLLKVPAAVRFLSIEPMLGPIELGLLGTLPGNQFSGYQLTYEHLNWVIAGGESGPQARTMNREWVRSLRDQCVEAGVPFHFKQWGEWAPNFLTNDDGSEIPGTAWDDRMGKKVAGRVLDGRTWDEFPRSAA